MRGSIIASQKESKMARISRDESNIYNRPKGTFIVNGRYVYMNTSNHYVSPEQKKVKGTRGYTGHDSKCIGVIADPNDPKARKFYANEAYLEMINATSKELPQPPKFADSVSAGFHCWVEAAAEQSGLQEALETAFGVDCSNLILDLATYMMSQKSAVMQHFPAWARNNALFSEDIANDTTLGKFIRDQISISKIKTFRDEWAKANLTEDGKIYLCYDSTNVNCSAQGVFIVQKGHAKDDPDLEQVNTDYVVRGSDGLPITYLHSPGSVADIMQAKEMIEFLGEMKKLTGKNLSLCMICDRGYISERNLKLMDGAGIDYILMLRTNFNLYKDMAEAAISEIRDERYLYKDDQSLRYGMTKDCVIYEGGPTCHAQIIWDLVRFETKNKAVRRQINKQRETLKKFIEKNQDKYFTAEELKWVPPYFDLELEEQAPQVDEESNADKSEARKKSDKATKKATFRIKSYSDNWPEINKEIQKSGLMILVTKETASVAETDEASAKRDCVEKAFAALKSHLGMDKIGVTTEEAMHGKGLVWFVASILRSLLFNKTSDLRENNKKDFTVPAIIDELEAIKGDRNLRTNKRQRRYSLTKRQREVLNKWGITEAIIDEKMVNIP